MKEDLKYKKVIDYIKTSPWPDDTDTNTIIKQAHKVYEDITKNKTKGKKLYRLCGQTGAGKTTQLLGAFEKYIEHENIDPLIVGVRTCSEYHPNYEEIIKSYDKGQIREITNGFALKCMTYLLKLLIENEYMIVLDLTLLDPIYEEYILDLVNEFDYKVEYHVLAVSPNISNHFIDKRFKETGRIVKKESLEYFNYILPIGLKYICNNDNKNISYVWNAYDEKYKYKGLIKDCYSVFERERLITTIPSGKEKELMEAKYNTLIKK